MLEAHPAESGAYILLGLQPAMVGVCVWRGWGLGEGLGPSQGKVYLGTHCEGAAYHGGDVVIAGMSECEAVTRFVLKSRSREK